MESVRHERPLMIAALVLAAVWRTAAWRVVNGTGRFEGISGGGRMRAVFQSTGREGRETFRGTVSP